MPREKDDDATAVGSHVRAGSEHAVSLGDGTFVGFPTKCEAGRGCGNPLCPMGCIRRVLRGELLHWAAGSEEAGQGAEPELEVVRSGVHGEQAVLRAVQLLGRDGSSMFGDEPERLGSWCWAEELRCGHDLDEAALDLRWLRSDAVASALAASRPAGGGAEPSGRCPISRAVPRAPATVDGVVYEAPLLLRWLSAGHALHPDSGKPLRADAEAVVRSLQAGWGSAAFGDRGLRGRLPLWCTAFNVVAVLLLLLAVVVQLRIGAGGNGRALRADGFT